MAGGVATPSQPPSSLLTSQLATIAFVMGTVQVLKRFDLEDPVTKNYIRAMYAVAQAGLWVVYYYIYTKIKENKGILGVGSADETGDWTWIED